MKRTIGSVIMVAAMLAACSKSEKPGAATETTGTSAKTEGVAPLAMTEAKELFKSRCAACHGETGLGDGPGAASLNPKPRNYTDQAWQKSVKDDDIKKVILYGGAAVGKSPIMPSSPDLESKPAVLDGLVKVVRGFGGK